MMKISSLLAVASTVAFSYAYLPVPYQTPAASATVPQRKDITTLSRQELDLVVYAIQRWQQGNAQDVGGYWQVAGIHGNPTVYWDNAGGYGTTSTGNKSLGYCFHVDQNFALWHRPYVALFEQQLIANAISIASTWYSPQRAAYQQAASTLRLPYWDWARVAGAPGQIDNATIAVTNPTTGQIQTIKNPLFTYTKPSDGELGNGLTLGSSNSPSLNTTYRADSRQNSYQRIYPSFLRKNTALLFNTANVCWNRFATSNSDQAKTCTGNTVTSLEGIHDNIHFWTGGTMMTITKSAFDPMFWFHHCQVDRVAALWQAINPNTKIVDTYSDKLTFVAGAGTRGESFQFLPFRKSQGNTDWWTAAQSYNVRNFGYTYPEIADQPSSSTVLSRVNALYGDGRTQSSVASTSAKLRRDVVERDGSSSLSTPPSSAELAKYAPVLIAPDGSFHEYTARCTINKSVAPGTAFALHLFFGNAPAVSSADDYLTAPNRVGGFAVLGGATDLKVTHAVVITDALLNTLIKWDISDLKQATVRKYIKANLTWKLVTADGQDIGEQAKGNLKVKVIHTTVTPAGKDELPTIAPADDVLDATDS